MNEVVIKMGRVESVIDNLDEGRLKVRIEEDKDKPLSELPYAFPINPKMFQCVPKEGEGVLIITSQLGNPQSQRYYLGPIISQMQEVNKASFGRSDQASTAALQGAVVEPHKPLSEFNVTDGAFPDKNDIALIGRKGNDVILRDDEIDLRCGIRKTAVGDEDKDLIGDVIFNEDNPAYIQMKHKPHLMNSGEGVINLVADKINIVSHIKDNGNNLDVKLVNPNSKNGNKTEPLLHDEDIDKLISQLHQLPYGDVLVKILRKMNLAITSHTHAMNGLPPVDGISIKNAKGINFDELLSNHVRIS